MTGTAAADRGAAGARDLAGRWTDGDAGNLDPATLPPALRLDLAWALKELCNARWNTEPDGARAAAQRLQQLHAADGAPAIAALAHWARGLAALTEGRMHEALQALQAAEAALQTLGHAHEAAKCQLPQGIALTLLGRHDEALAVGEAARSRFIALGDGLSTGKVELNLGSMLMRRDAYALAEQRYRDAAARLAAAGADELQLMAEVGLAGALTWQFRFDAAQQLYAAASRRAGAPGLEAVQGLIDSNLGRLELHRGRFEAALRALTAALHESEQAGLPHEATEARRDLADAYLALNLLPEALELYERTVAEGLAQDAPVECAWAQVQRAQVLARLGRLQSAQAALDAAHAGFVQHGVAVGAGLVDLRRAQLALARGDDVAAVDADAALQQARSAARVFADAGVAGWRCDADIVAARALVALGRPAAAQSAFLDTLARADHLPEQAAACHTGLGSLAAAAGARTQAQWHFEQAIAGIEMQRALLPGDEFRTAYGSDKQSPYEGLLALALQDNRPADSALLLRCAERARSAALRTALARDGGRDGAAVTAAGTDPQAREQLHWLHGQWQQALAQGEPERAQALQQRLHAAERSLLEAQRRALAAGTAAAGGPAAVAQPPGTLPDAARLQAALRDGEVLVHYTRVDGADAAAAPPSQPRRQQIVVCVLTATSLQHVVVPADGLDDRIAQLRFQLDALRFGAPALRARAAQIAARTRAHLQALHRQLWQPVAALVGDAAQVVVVPHGNLHYVPFCALHDGSGSLVQRHALCVAPSAALWAAWRQRPAPASPQPPRRVVALGTGGAALPHVADEVRAVAAAFQAQPGGSATACVDDAATLQALHALLPEADVLHLACHGQFRADSPYFSALHLADGTLTLRDAAALPLRAQLVTLSACETGLSRIAPGDELVGLVRGFVLAGAPNVLATLWTVDDAGTAALMRDFYAALLQGRRPAAALRLAQCAALASDPDAWHWAAFTLHGSG
ncbi:CHAT domain-containing protein [Rubrivivax sp. RP6-9]|uniref:CHAT domain-containing protein n=1 Tax=Rubrivivax sp. RP6-9 TaxID=3415750 RepID=UPI003CC57DE0